MSMAETGSEPEDRVRRISDAAAGAVEERVDKAAGAASDVISKASDTASHAVGAVAGAVTDAIDARREEVIAGARQAADFVAGIGGDAVDHVKHHPTRTVLLVAAGAAVIGFIVGAMTAKRR